jgi:hypothetical protein
MAVWTLLWPGTATLRRPTSPVRGDIFVESQPNIFKLRQQRHKKFNAKTQSRQDAKCLIEFSLVPLRHCAFALIPVTQS